MRHIGSARNGHEVTFWYYLQGCSRCGERAHDQSVHQLLSEPGDRIRVSMTCRRCGNQDVFAYVRHYEDLYRKHHRVATCPRCGRSSWGAEREADWDESGMFIPTICEGCGHPPPTTTPFPHFDQWARGPELGGPDPSLIITPWRFARELERCVDDVNGNARADARLVQRLAVAPRGWNPVSNGRTCSIELAKFLVGGSVPETDDDGDAAREYRRSHPEQFTRTHIEGRGRFFEELERDVLRATVTAVEPEGTRVDDGIRRRFVEACDGVSAEAEIRELPDGTHEVTLASYTTTMFDPLGPPIVLHRCVDRVCPAGTLDDAREIARAHVGDPMRRRTPADPVELPIADLRIAVKPAVLA